MPVTYRKSTARRNPLFAVDYPKGDPACVKGARAVLADKRLMAFLDVFEALVTRKGVPRG